MPNHCDNDLFVTGKKEDVDAFIEFAKFEDEELSMEPFIPYPEKFAKKDREARLLREKAERGEITTKEAWDFTDGFNSGGYEWCINNRGTKWGFYDVYASRQHDTEMFYQFNTAWAPALPVIAKMGEMFPKLKFKLMYYEQGCGFRGCLIVQKGKITSDWCKENYRGGRGG